VSAAAGGRAAVVRYLARQMSWHVLHTYRHHGLAAAAEALGTCGGVGRDDDGMFRSWFTEAGGRRLTYREGSMTAPIMRVPLRAILDHADRRLTAAEWQRIDQLVAARDVAAVATRPREHYHSPSRRSDAENVRIAAGHRAMLAAERELRDLVAAALTDQHRAGEQLALFGSLTGDSTTRGPDRFRRCR